MRGVPVWLFPRQPCAWRSIREFQISFPLHDWLKVRLSDYALVHIHVLFSFVPSVGMMTARKLKIPYLISPAGLLSRWSMSQGWLKKRLFWQFFEKANLREAAVLHYTSDQEKIESARWAPQPKSLVAALGCESSTGLKEEALRWREKFNCLRPIPLFLFLGRIHKKKGLEQLLQALAQCTVSEWNLVIAGEGEPNYRQALKQLTERLSLTKRIYWVPFVSGREKASLFEAADLFCLTSFSENFALTVAESLSQGTPVLVTKGVALAVEIRQKDLGIVCDPNVPAIRDGLNRWGQELAKWRGKRETIRQMATEAWNWTTCAKQLASSYRGILEESEVRH